MKPDQKLRQNVGRIDHIVFFYRTFERLEDTRLKMSAVLGLDEDDWEPPDLVGPPLSACTVLCWRAGLELVCPKPGHEDDPNWIGAPLIAARGEGLHMVAFGVDDIHAACRRANRAGFPIVQTLQDSRHPDKKEDVVGPVPWFFGDAMERPFDLIREAIITPFNATNLAFAQIEPKNPE